jgi:hypothetical protein
MNRSYSDDQIVDPYVGWPDDVLAISTLVPLGKGRGRRLPKPPKPPRVKKVKEAKPPRVKKVKEAKPPRVKKVKPATPPDKQRFRQPLVRGCALHRVIRNLGSQAELARRLGMKISQGSTIRWWVTRQAVPAKWIHKVATVGNISVGELMADWSSQGVKRGR